jgi:hypothetical protein
MAPARHRDHLPVAQRSGLGLLPTELQMDVMVHLLGKEEREYHVEMESPEPVGGSSFEARADASPCYCASGFCLQPSRWPSGHVPAHTSER